MKKVFSLMTLLLMVSVSFAIAAGPGSGCDGDCNVEGCDGDCPYNNDGTGNQEMIATAAQVGAQVMAGNYYGANGQMIQVKMNNQNRIQLQAGNVSAECSQNCNMTQAMVQNQTKLYAKMSNGQNAEIKVMPDTASQKAMQRLQLKVCSEDNGCSLELKEVGSGNQTRMAYEVQAEKQYRMLGIFKATGNNKVEVDAETGEVLSTKAPWWSFLASEVSEEDSEA